MTSSGIFLDYQGNIDYPVIDSLLTKLKKTEEFQELFTTIRKRTYSLIVECIENICKHSALKSSDDVNLQSKFCVRNEENKITISAGNPIREEKRDKLIQRIEYVNGLDSEELRKLHEERINTEPVKGENGAGLGLICMAFKSGNKLSYSFKPLIPGYLFFEIQIILNK